jgi:hypothetical protein
VSEANEVHKFRYKKMYAKSFSASPFDKVVKSLKSASFVIPANPGSESGAGAGIQYFQ